MRNCTKATALTLEDPGLVRTPQTNCYLFVCFIPYGVIVHKGDRWEKILSKSLPCTRNNRDKSYLNAKTHLPQRLMYYYSYLCLLWRV